ncbi:hypothetical protein OVA07_13910 [Novosphingobium sp. SL115]|uniref:hypothetical protein n=1 Tax=Novosphingobium sp. SL115 TaxID=2995150 RepID=UPI002273D4F3|nr:hypothetical protein [Novosphingobium sp. SL115]MCY1672098.1 hypothetical protein [Novosphingobium sp. SL115]
MAQLISSEFGNETAERMAVPIQTTAYVLNRVENHENYVTSVSQMVLSRTWRMTNHLEQIRYYGSSQKAVYAIVRHVGERGARAQLIAQDLARLIAIRDNIAKDHHTEAMVTQLSERILDSLIAMQLQRAVLNSARGRLKL